MCKSRNINVRSETYRLPLYVYTVAYEKYAAINLFINENLNNYPATFHVYNLIN